LTIAPRLFKTESIIDLSKHGWRSFRDLLQVRHATTHPKEIVSLVVDADVITKGLPAARGWYDRSLLSARRTQSSGPSLRVPPSQSLQWMSPARSRGRRH